MESPAASNNTAIDLSLRTVVSPNLTNSMSSVKEDHTPAVIRPIPRPPWTIMWYQSLWTQNKVHPEPVPLNISSSSSLHSVTKAVLRKSWPKIDLSQNILNSRHSGLKTESQLDPINRNESPHCQFPSSGMEKFTSLNDSQSSPNAVLDIACCDGPVIFERVSNPNFALTVEHNEESSPMDENDSATKESPRHLSLKTYVCIYCNQSFKSLFCYQKHKKRHLNPVSVDITATQATYNRCASESKTRTKDLNVQFFPCKKCGCKFPSYYFVHKHRKVCH